MNINNILYINVEKEIAERDLSRKEIAKKAGMSSQSFTNKIKSLKLGKSINTDSLEKISIGLGVSVSYLTKQTRSA